MGWRNSQQANEEAAAYDKAASEADERGSRDSAEMFRDMAADKRVEAGRAATGARPRGRR
jgi:hypothetical protein